METRQFGLYLRSIFIFILSLFLNLIPELIYCQTEVSGIQSGTWSKANSPYRVIGDIVVSEGDSLIIEAGVVVNFAQRRRILINGTLLAVGTIEDSIIFKHETSGSKHNGLDFKNTGTTSKLSYCRIQDGIADATPFYGGWPDDEHGGGIFIDDSSPQITNCRIVNNQARWGGGIFILRASNALIRNNVISGNTAHRLGGGLGLNGQNGGNDPRIENNLVIHNTSQDEYYGGGGISFYSNSNASLFNNVFWNNNSKGGGGGLRIHLSGNSIRVKNCIFWNNSSEKATDEIDPNDFSADLTVEYSNISGGYTGTGNININPGFIDAYMGNFRFYANSPCVDSGTPDTTGLGFSKTDFDHNPRLFDGNRDGTARIDIGPYEYINTPPLITSSPLESVDEDEIYSYLVTADDPDVDEVLTFSLIKAPSFLRIDSETGEIAGNPGNDDVGIHDVTLQVSDLNHATDMQSFKLDVIQVNDPPVVSNIPDQQIAEGDSFMNIHLDDYVVDVDNSADELRWNYTGNVELMVSIDLNRVATVSVPSAIWKGVETIIFTATDPGGLSGSDTATFTVKEQNKPPVIAELPVWMFNEDDSLIISMTSLYQYVDDPDHPDSLLVFSFKPGEFVSIYQDSVNVVMKAPAHWFGKDSLEVRVSDGELADSAHAIVIVNSVNDIPFFVRLPDTVQFINNTDTTLIMSQYADDYDLPYDSLRWQFEVSNDSVLLQFDGLTTELKLSAPGFVGMVVVLCEITDDSCASAIDSFYVKVVCDPTGIADITEIIPTQYSLGQNYPNPFNPVTYIKFALPDAGDVKIEIYNILGQRILTLWDGFKPAGYHIVQFDAPNLASGLYFYSLQYRESRQVNKMILMK